MTITTSCDTVLSQYTMSCRHLENLLWIIHQKLHVSGIFYREFITKSSVFYFTCGNKVGLDEQITGSLRIAEMYNEICGQLWVNHGYLPGHRFTKENKQLKDFFRNMTKWEYIVTDLHFQKINFNTIIMFFFYFNFLKQNFEQWNILEFRSNATPIFILI